MLLLKKKKRIYLFFDSPAVTEHEILKWTGNHFWKGEEEQLL